MKKKSKTKQSEYIDTLNMNGLRGRMLRIPSARSKHNREILLVYGHHCSLERMFGLAEYMSKFGHVTMPDLPGFGGMDTFYKKDSKPTLDNMADYLAAFVKLRYKRRRVTIAGMSFGFLVVTRMLQRHPEIVKKVDLLVSIVGFAHKEDFHFSKPVYWSLRSGAKLLSYSWMAKLARYGLLNGPMIRLAYKLVENKHSKLHDADPEETKRRIEFEIGLWQCNDVQTYAFTGLEMLRANLCHTRVKLLVHHVSVEGDRYFDNSVVEQHLNVIYDKVTVVKTEMPAHAPSVIATSKEAAVFIPKKIRNVLNKS